MAELKQVIKQFFSSGASGEQYSLSQLKSLFWTKALEITDKKEGLISSDELRECTAQAAREIGEKGSTKELLLARSRLVMSLIRTKVGKTPKEPMSFDKAKYIGWFLAVLAFAAGVLTNEFSVTGNKINLLSPPLLGLLLWNLIVYLVLILSFFFFGKNSPNGPLRKILFTLLNKVQFKGLKVDEAHKRFLADWEPFETKILKTQTAEIFHWAACCFGLGVVFAVGLHGWATAYTVGWESTWLAQTPEVVRFFIKNFYGLIPLNDGITDSLTLQTIEQMRFDRPEVFPAAPWLIRLFILVAVIVVIPRAFLALVNHRRIKYLKNHCRLDTDVPYFLNILRQWKGNTMTIQVVPFSYVLTNDGKLAIEQLARDIHPENSDVHFYAAQHEDTELPAIKGGTDNECFVLFGLTATPEAEVQGRFLEEIKKLCASKNCPLTVLVDSAKFTQLFSYAPQRIEERKKNWSDFLDRYKVIYAFVDLSNLNSEKLVSDLKAKKES